MASKFSSSLIALMLIFNIFVLLPGQAVAGRNIQTGSKNADVKQPEWLDTHHDDRSFLIPGFGRVMVPPYKHKHPYGGSGGHTPGAENAYTSNPGSEVPAPAPYI